MTDFDIVWAQFPRKTNKLAARKAWNKLNPDTETVQQMIDALKWQTQTEQWQRGIIPHFSTWLRQERWTDEAPPRRPVSTSTQSDIDAVDQQIAFARRRDALMAQGMSRAEACTQIYRERGTA